MEIDQAIARVRVMQEIALERTRERNRAKSKAWHRVKLDHPDTADVISQLAGVFGKHLGVITLDDGGNDLLRYGTVLGSSAEKCGFRLETWPTGVCPNVQGLKPGQKLKKVKGKWEPK